MNKQKWVVVFPIVQIKLFGYPESVTVFARTEQEATELAEKKVQKLFSQKTTHTN